MTDTPTQDVNRDWRNLNLSPGGRSLIEASAGTGKTWTISVLYLRFLLEEKFSPKQIVVTTFTNAAAEEFKERVRARLIWAEKLAVSDAQKADSENDTLWLQQRWQHNPQVRIDDVQKLRLALAELDMAPVTTLHGLCQRILSDYPFESGTLFQPGELVSGAGLVSELAKDLQRILFQGNDEELVKLYKLHGKELTNLTKKLGLLMRPGSKVNNPYLSEQDIRQKLPLEWSTRLQDLCLNIDLFAKNSKLIDYWQQLAKLIENPVNDVVIDDAFLKALKDTRRKLADNPSKVTYLSKTGKSSPEIMQAAIIAESIAESGILDFLKHHHECTFLAAVATWAKAQAELRLAANNQRSFDGLLSSVHDALHASNGHVLADALFNSWPVALVDEFQDTDAIQYGILQRIYSDAENKKRGRLVMIGDPKQAIYRFRGGDVQAYLQAAQEADADGHMTLGVNHRSSKNYVQAVNEWYALTGKALSADVSHEITYHHVESSSKHSNSPYQINGESCQRPLIIHYNANPPEAAGERKAKALQVCADQIQDMLASKRHKIGDCFVNESDIAVLLPANSQLIELRDLLQARNIPCVTLARSSVFKTELAKDLQIILYAIAECTDLTAVRAAVATRLWGFDYTKLRELGDNPSAWQEISQKFHAWHVLWQQVGVLSVVNALMDEIAVVQLNTINGERVLTDLRHLGELLHAQSEHLGGAEQLLEWFRAQRSAESDEDEEAAESAQLRIESDAKRVRLMTLHASKGLEFPIVFLPLMWAHGENSDSGPFQISTMDGVKLLDIDDASKSIQNKELHDERFRILYVALTRAIHACHILTLPNDRPTSKRSAKAAEGTQRSALDVMLKRLAEHMDYSQINEQSTCICWGSEWPSLACKDIVAEQTIVEPRQAREKPKPPRKVLPAKHSFTTLMNQYEKPDAQQELPAEDERDFDELESYDLGEIGIPETIEVEREPEAPHAELLKFAVVRGADFGNAVHSIFENRQIGATLPEQTELMTRFLAQNNVRSRDGRAVGGLVADLGNRLQAVLETPLGNHNGKGPRLADLSELDLRAEMEFHFTLNNVSLNAIRKVCAKHGEPELIPDNNRHLSGLMNGKIDLTFQFDGQYHVLDYKGNYLGDRLSDYVGDALLAKMDKSHYRFQALLYTLAVDRYLSQRISTYERSKHLGSCYYLFVRAVGLTEDAGIWRHSFPDALIDDVQSILSSHKAEAA